MGARMTDRWTGGRDAFGDFAPGMVHYTDRVLFDEVWEREGLSKRDRSLVTVAALTALGKTDQLRFHLAYARDNGAQGDRRGVGRRIWAPAPSRAATRSPAG